MTKKRGRRYRKLDVFQPADPHDPFDNFLANTGNAVADLVTKKITKELAGVMGLGGMSIQNEIAVNRSRIMLQKTEVELEKTKMLSERQLRILDLKIMEKESEIQRRQQAVENALAEKARLQLPVNTTVIEGALEVAASPDGISGRYADESGDHELWLSSFGEGKVSVVLGRRGGGKTALAGKMAEFAMAKHQMPIYWIGLPAQAKDLLPHWVKLVDSPEQCPVGCFMLIDEAGIQYLSLAEASDMTRAYTGPHGFDPLPSLQKLNIPSLWVLGARDSSIPIPLTAEILDSLIDDYGKDFSYIVYPNMNHGWRDEDTGQMYPVLYDALKWLNKKFGD